MLEDQALDSDRGATYLAEGVEDDESRHPHQDGSARVNQSPMDSWLLLSESWQFKYVITYEGIPM